jgi:FdhE protein
MTLAPAATRETRTAGAAARWAAILTARPDLEPAVSLQRQLIGRVIDLTDTVEHARLPRLSLPPRYLAAKLARGVPALAAEPIPLPVAIMTPALIAFCDDLAKGGAGETADHIRAAIVDQRMDAGSLLTASLHRDQQAIRTGAVHRGLSPDLVWLIAELAVSPYVHVLQQALLARGGAHDDPAIGAALDNWPHGYCPACGSWPALAEIHQAHRVLRCSFCAHAWELKSFACVYCGEGGARFVIFAGTSDDRRVEICGSCAGYLKTLDVTELSPFPLLAIGDLETMDLDVMAMEKRYRRPPLREFTTRGPKS